MTSIGLFDLEISMHLLMQKLEGSTFRWEGALWRHTHTDTAGSVIKSAGGAQWLTFGLA